MVNRSFHSLWTVDRWLPPIGASHIGTSHVATELPNQDSYQVEQWDDQQATFAAISDGLGKSFEAQGSKLMTSKKLGFLGTCPSNLGTGREGRQSW